MAGLHPGGLAGVLCSVKGRLRRVGTGEATPGAQQRGSRRSHRLAKNWFDSVFCNIVSRILAPRRLTDKFQENKFKVYYSW